MEEKLIYRDNQALLLSLGLGEPATQPAKSAEALKKLHIAAQKRKLKDETRDQNPRVSLIFFVLEAAQTAAAVTPSL